MLRRALAAFLLLALLLHFVLADLKFYVNTQNQTGSWNHFWENCVGSGHAALALRADYQAQMTKAHNDLGFKQVRFHGLFVDDMSVVLPGNNNDLLFSFFNIDRIFDFLLGIGMRPLVEISFMPKLLASGNQTWSHYEANITPPKNWTQWTLLIESFITHLIARYGLEEISQWHFEVWNEPNCCPHDFWVGSEQDYFHLYNVTAQAIKAVNSNVKVGGPATAMSSWIGDFLHFCQSNSVPLDFITTHEYPTDPPGPETRTFFSNHLKATRATVGSSLPIFYTEYDDGYNSPTSYGAAFAVYQNYMANGVVDTLSWWVFSDLFEEQGMYPNPFQDANGNMPVDGLMNVYGIPKPSYRAFQLMHWSGSELVSSEPNLFSFDNDTLNVFAVTGNHTSIFLLNWQVMPRPIQEETVTVQVTGLKADVHSLRAVAYYIDSQHTTAYPLWLKMGQPMYLNTTQIEQLNSASELVPSAMDLIVVDEETVQFSVTVPPQSLVNVVLLN